VSPRMQKAKAALLKLLGDPQPEWALGVGLNEGGQTALFLYASETPNIKLPSILEGVPLEVRVIGAIEARLGRGPL
jgi:hypothetical protein